MADIVDKETRSRMMAGIRGKDTKPEIMLRKALFGKGFRYRLHDKRLPGKPDIVFPGKKAVILVHGCFWHGHDCHLFKWPSTRQEFWHAKINRNREKDTETLERLDKAGWRIGIVWECALKGKKRLSLEEVTGTCASWLESPVKSLEIAGKDQHPT